MCPVLYACSMLLWVFSPKGDLKLENGNPAMTIFSCDLSKSVKHNIFYYYHYYYSKTITFTAIITTIMITLWMLYISVYNLMK